jgi:hypothetical protein
MSNLPPPLPDEDPPLQHPRTTAGATAWVLVFLDGLLLGCGALYWLARGRFFDENVYEKISGTPWTTITSLFPSIEKVASVAVRLSGVLGLCASILVMAVALTGYRRGERWAWYATWALPFYCSLEIATLAGYRALTPTVAVWDIALLTVALLALITPYQWFFAPRPRDADALAN